MASKTASVEHTRKEKRDAEGDGRDLLVAYLSDVGGYDRNYRDVEGQDESGSSGNIVDYCTCGLHMKTLSDSHRTLVRLQQRKYETSTRRPPFDRPVPILLVTCWKVAYWNAKKITPIKTCFATREEKSHDQLYRDFAVASSPIPSLRLSVNSLRFPDLHWKYSQC